jgi:hypothetical protein
MVLNPLKNLYLGIFIPVLNPLIKGQNNLQINCSAAVCTRSLGKVERPKKAKNRLKTFSIDSEMI